MKNQTKQPTYYCRRLKEDIRVFNVENCPDYQFCARSSDYPCVHGFIGRNIRNRRCLVEKAYERKQKR